MRVLQWTEFVPRSGSDLPAKNLQALAHNMQYNSDLILKDNFHSAPDPAKTACDADRIGNANIDFKNLCRDY
jgi:hypothetical protein